ncbi:hypothetical protein V8J88_13265 [Massilia sp. W12]|uniref:hypothetical protein n=1 Tax=Massilia sp. W12 TaxID=3126507 RepID=UPI0030CA8688
MQLEIEWQTGTPKFQDLYLAAIKLENDAGYYAFLSWDGETWDQTYPEEVIAFYPASEFVRLAGPKWPEPELTPEIKETSKTDIDKSEFEEFDPDA